MESKEGSGIRANFKIVGYIIVWLLALFATNPSCAYWALAYLFPIGLAAFVNLRLGNDGGWGVLIGCYTIYLVHAIFYFRANTTRATVFLFALLVILLVCNVSGCRAQLPQR